VSRTKVISTATTIHNGAGHSIGNCHDRACLGADVNAAGRFIQNQQVWVCGKPPGQQHFLLVPTGQVLYLLVSGRELDHQLLDKAVRDLLGLCALDDFTQSPFGLKGDDDVLPNCQISYNLFRFPVLGAEGDTAANGLQRVLYAALFSSDVNFAGGMFVRTEDQPGNLAPSGA